MNLKQVILSRLDRDTMKRVLDELGIEDGVDRRSVEAMSALLSRKGRASPAVLLGYLNEYNVKIICDEIGISSRGRRGDLIQRIVEDAASSRPPTPAKPAGEPAEPPDAVVMVKAKPDDLTPFTHQQSAWDAMSKHFTDAGGAAGIVVVPTGGGKTEIASRWLLQHHVRTGGRVLWFAHRRSLLRQAFNNVVRNAHLALPLEHLRLIRVSSSDAAWSAVSADHHFVFASVQSAATERNLGFLDRFAHDSRRPVFVVVDEAHHAAAPSYQRVLDLLKNLKARLLGLTATPVRMDDDDNRRLWEVFDRRCVYQVLRGELIQRGILSIPHVETVKTQVEAERDFTPEEHAHLGRFGELAPSVLERLAKNASRNRLIVQHYTANAAKYGKTILFAADTLHAQTLAAEFKLAGVDADYVDYTRPNCQGVMDAFRDRHAPAVLANVEMLTEGYDAPRTQTVFIARPTRSDALLSQMVGRALRGPKAGGTPEAYLVTFVDTWKDYHVLDTRVVVAEGHAEPAREPQRWSGPLTRIADELVLEAYKMVNSVYKGHFVGFYACLPHAWYVWEEESEGDVIRRCVLVFENQREGFERLHADWIAPGRLPAGVSEDFARDRVAEFFEDVPDPLPSVPDVVGLLNAYANGQHVAHHSFEEKKGFDPATVARQLEDARVGEARTKIKEIFDGNSLCRWVYHDDLEAFTNEVFAALAQPTDVSSKPVSPEVLRWVPTQKLAEWPPGHPGYDPQSILATVTISNRHFPHGAPRVSSTRFSARLRSTWGFCRYSDRSIVLSATLNSPDVPLFVVEFLTYHEALHADMPNTGHNPEFRIRERAFLPSAEALADAQARDIEPGSSSDAWRVLSDQFLDTFHARFLTGHGQRPLYY